MTLLNQWTNLTVPTEPDHEAMAPQPNDASVWVQTVPQTLSAAHQKWPQYTDSVRTRPFTAPSGKTVRINTQVCDDCKVDGIS
jgi:hypothetical protein